MNKDYKSYVRRMEEIACLGNAIGLMQWDKEVYMPKGSTELRARQISGLAGLAHVKFVDPDFGSLLDRLNTDDSLEFVHKRNIALTLRDYKKEVKLSQAFVEKLSRASAVAFHAWEKAKANNDYTLFYPDLEVLINLKLEEAEIRGYEDHPYDVFLDLYEPDLRVSKVDVLFSTAREGITRLLADIRPEQHSLEDTFLKKTYPRQAQWDFGIDMLNGLGYNFERGRQDVSTHPFTIGFAPDDVRITTRIDEQDFSNMIWSCLHEAGHALYEQGLPANAFGLPHGSSTSLGIHESQSRLWENHVGRSRAFWKHWLSVLRDRFPDQLHKVDLDTFYRAINKLGPNLIRTEADELHYHLHIIIRYELEKALFDGSIRVSDLKDSWNAKYKEYLGIDVPDDAQGILQDVHWSHGSFGYFPTYSLGSFYAAQIYDAAGKAVPDLELEIANGNCAPLLAWLRDNIHRHGRTYHAEDLCKQVTGSTLQVEPFLRYADAKFKAIYTI